MGKEIERKFLIVGEIPFHIGEPKLIKQAYIFAEKGKHLRIRVSDGKSIIGLKYTEGLVRDEFEYEVPLEEALFMYKKSELKIEKIRFKWEHGKLHFDLDLFPNGIKFLEVEFPDEEHSKAFIKYYEANRDWIGEEITGKSEYSNIVLASKKLSFNNG